MADATSRKPLDDGIAEEECPYVSLITAVEEDEEDQCDEEATFVNTVVRRYVDKMRAVTWERIKSETNNDPLMCELSKCVQQGFPSKRQEMPPQLREYWDCLLYTSPSPRDLSTSRMPSSA